MDIDDTLYPNRALGVGGLDTRLRRKTPYPCVRELGRSVAPLPILLLSARPNMFLSTAHGAHVLGREEAEVFGAGGNTSSIYALWGLYGRQDIHNYFGIGICKANTIRKYREMLDNFGLTRVKLVFIGDSGQGDITCARSALGNKDLEAAYIHVVDVVDAFSSSSHLEKRLEERMEMSERGMPLETYFCDYREVMKSLQKAKYANPDLAKARCPGEEEKYDYADACRWRLHLLLKLLAPKKRAKY